ncbi:MAG: alpha/beta hydrolase, partial [Bacteroidota bacterium]
VVQIAHGMAEHAARYDRFAERLNREGMAVWANDHRGHGLTAGTPEQVGYFEESSFWTEALGDMHQFLQLIRKQHPDCPVFLFGHSMGSLLSRDFISIYGREIDGVVLSATAGDPGLFLKGLGLLVTGLAKTFQGRLKRNPLLDKLTFGEYNQAFRPNRTAFDWLSRDEAEVDRYVEDPYCGPIFTTGFFNDLIHGALRINRSKAYETTPSDLPVLLIAGDKDPVGNQSKGVQEVFEKYKKAGLSDVHCKFYPDARHELLNEINRDEVMQDIIDWLGERISRKA